MTHPLFDFEFFRDGDLYCAAWSSIDGEVFAPRWNGLFVNEYGSDADSNPWLAYAINNGFGEAALAVRLLAWALTDGLERAVIPSYYRDESARELGRAVDSTDFVRWQYEVGCDARTEERGDLGFVPGWACAPDQAHRSGFEEAHVHEAGVFRISSYDELNKVSLAVSGDASSEVTIFGLRSGSARYSNLLVALRTSARPALSELLAADEIFVHVGLDHDGFGLSSVLVKSGADIEDKLRVVSARVASAFAAYVAAVPEVTTWPEWFDAIKAMEQASIG